MELLINEDNETFFSNFSGNVTTDPDLNASSWSSILLMCVSSLVFALIILSTVLGNAMVILAVNIERNLQNISNRLIVSLAVADLMVACFVMGPAAHYMVRGTWYFGAIGCDLWTTADILSCSASILHLLAVALDRWLAVSAVNYAVNRSKKHIDLIILTVWCVAACVSSVQLGWKDPHFWERLEEHRCTVSQSVGYQIFATLATFYIPTTILLILYLSIWRTAKRRIRHRVGGNNHKPPPSSTSMNPMPSAKIPMSSTFSGDELSCHTATVETSSESVVGSPMTPVVGDVQEMEQIPNPTIYCDQESGINPSVGPSENQLSLKPPGSPFRASQGSLSENEPQTSKQVPSNSNHKIKDLQKKKETLEAKRERKAASTLAIITGAFIVCWSPFFVMVVVMAVCKECELPEYLINLIQWLGYLNSTINPVIYTIFNPEFRVAFKRIIFGTKTSRRRRH